MCFASSHVGHALPVSSTVYRVFVFSMSTFLDVDVVVGATSAFAYLPSKQAKCFPLHFLKSVRTAEAEGDRFRERQQSRVEVREFEERTSACLASYQTSGSVWLLVHVKCVGVACARCGWKTWLNV